MAESFLDLVNRLDGDVEKMIREGVATKADGLTVKVKVNEAEMLLTKVDNGLALSKNGALSVVWYGFGHEVHADG